MRKVTQSRIRNARTRAKFIEVFAACGQIEMAAKHCGVSKWLHYEWLKRHPDYLEAFEEAKERVADMLESEAVLRAKYGTKKPIYHQGKVVGYVQEYSDALLMFLLKGMKRKKYGDKIDGELKATLSGAELVRAILDGAKTAELPPTSEPPAG